jgi:WD40 repeat protein
VGSLAWCGFSSSGRISFGSPSSPGESSSPHGRHTPSIASVVSAPPIGTGACSGLLASGSRDKSIFLHDPRIRSFYGSPDDFPRNIDSLFSTPSKDLGDVSDLFTASRLSSDTRPPLFPAMSLDGCSNQGSSLDDWISVSSDACASSDIIHAPLSLGLGSLARSGFNRDSLLCDGMATYSFPSSRAGLECTNEPGNGTLSPNSEFNDGYSTKLTDSPHILKVVSSSIEEQSFSDGLFDDFVYPSTPPRPSSSHKVTSPSVFSTPHRDSPSGQAHRRTISSSPVSTGARRSGSGGGMDSPFARYPTFTPPKSRKSASNHSFGASPSLSQNFSHPPGVVSVLSMHRQEICGLKWSLDGTHLASGSNDNNLCVWKPMHGRGSSPLHVLSEHSAAVKALAWSPHQHHVLASGGGTADRHIRFWNVLTGSALERVDTGSQVCNLAWSSHSNEIVSTHGYSLNQIVVWKYPSMQKLATLTGHSYR